MFPGRLAVSHRHLTRLALQWVAACRGCHETACAVHCESSPDAGAGLQGPQLVAAADLEMHEAPPNPLLGLGHTCSPPMYQSVVVR